MMACLRELSFKGRRGTFQCDEEGCELRLIKDFGYTEIIRSEPEDDCLLQLRLRAGDAEHRAKDLKDGWEYLGYTSDSGVNRKQTG